MESSFELFILLFFGLFLIIRFKQLGEFTDKQARNIPSPFPKKWNVVISQTLVLIVGCVFFIVALLKLIG